MRCLRQLALALAAVAVVTVASAQTSTPVQAQGLFSFFSGQLPRETVVWRHSHRPGTIVVSFGDRRLYKVMRGRRAISYPIAIPRNISRWSGTLSVTRKAVNPSWTPTPRMRRENPKLPAYVPGGHPRNPMGVRALYLGSTMYRIHGTDAPWTIGKAVSKGCIRMYNSHVVDLYNRTRTGTRVIVTWKRYRPRQVAGFW
ncbi:MAG: L,D-transpeptidase [Pseudomonadota bacterium]